MGKGEGGRDFPCFADVSCHSLDLEQLHPFDLMYSFNKIHLVKRIN